MRRFVTFGPAFVVMLAATVALLATPRIARMVSFARTEAMLTVAQRSLDDDDILERLNRAIRNVANAVEPSVVHVDVRFDRDSEGDRGSSGSGWVYDISGHIITNAHVVRDASAISIQFFDGRLASAELLGADPFTDIAVLKVDTQPGLFPARRATGEQPQQGDRVFAFGSPFGFKFSMSEGIVSGLGRSARPALEFGGFSAFIQTDAAVNPGNSGGPLVDVRGRVIGMNVAIATARDKRGTAADEGQSAGISFAIPLGTIESIVDQLIRTGKVARGYLGIRFSSGADGVPIRDGQNSLGTGVLVGDVEPADGPAARAGLRSGDIIAAIAGQSITGPEVLRSVVSSNEPGKTVPIKIWREGQFLELPLVLGEMPASVLTREAVAFLPGQLGVAVRQTRRGLFIEEILPDSTAYRAGLRPGQQILAIAGQEPRGEFEFYTTLIDNGLLVGKGIEIEYAPVPDEESNTSPAPQRTVLRIGR
ncbi:MAG: trypsin-like peptidase domain-containing protein [Phycisphaerales bacterium]|nr:trypsin-like peptidase domain-containing protein [Phycisphaerales bacterium]